MASGKETFVSSCHEWSPRDIGPRADRQAIETTEDARFPAGQNQASNRPVVITGATGFIGSATTRELLTQGLSVKAARRASYASASYMGAPVSTMNLQNLDSVKKVVNGAGLIIHLAGTGSPSSPTGKFREIVTTNVLGTETLIEAAVQARVPRVVIVSSSAVYGSVKSEKLYETMPVMPVSVYGITKLAAERISAAYSASEAIEIVCLRVFNTYGPNQWIPSQQKFLIPQLIRSMLQGRPIQIRGDGNQTRDYVHVDDVVRTIVTAGLQPSAPQPVINVGTGRPISVNQIVEAVAQRLGVTPVIERQAVRPGEIMHVVADTTLLRDSLGLVLERGILEFMTSITEEEISRYRQSVV